MSKPAKNNRGFSENPKNEKVFISESFKPGVKSNFKRIFFASSKKTYATVLLTILIVTGLGYGAYIYSQPALKIGNYSYDRQAYRRLLAEAKESNVSKQDARKALIEGLSARAAADELGVLYPTEQTKFDEAARFKFGLMDDQGPSEYQRIATYPLVIQPVLRVHQSGGYKVAIVNFPFSRYLVGFAVEDRFGESDLIGNEQAVREDISYAKATSEKYLQQYQKDKRPISEIINEVRADKRLVYGQASNLSRTAYITANATEESIYGTEEVIPELQDRIRTLATKAGVAQLYEEKFTALSAEYGVNMPDIDRDGAFTLVGWYMLAIDEKIEQQSNLTERYIELKKRYSEDAN